MNEGVLERSGARQLLPTRGLIAAATAALWAAWLALFAPTLRWLGTLAAEEYRLSLVLLVAILAVLALRARELLRAGELSGPALRPLPSALAVGCAASHAAVERWLDVDILSATLFVLGGYGLSGLSLPAGAWRSALPAVLLLCAALPFGHHLNVYIGFPARVLTAQLVHQALSAWKVASLPAESILVLENGVASVELPCSGMKSLWTGGLFLLAATAVEQRAMGARWGLVAALHGALLFSANVARVLALVLLAFVVGEPRLADLLHVPLGVAGFGLACAAALLLLRGCPRGPAEAEPGARAPAPRFALALALAFGLLTAARAPRPPTLAPASLGFGLPPELHAEPIALTPPEADLFGRHGARPTKVRFDFRGLRGSLLLVPSSSWRSHHPPEQCLVAGGLSLDGITPVSLAPGFSANALALDGGRRAALYWFQSSRSTTPTLLERMRRELLGGEGPWVLVSVLLDGPASEDFTGLAGSLRQVVAEALAREHR